MAPIIAAVCAFVLFWLLVLGIRLVLRDSVIDPLAALVASLAVAALAYRALARHRT
jgi:hypothetical protein